MPSFRRPNAAALATRLAFAVAFAALATAGAQSPRSQQGVSPPARRLADRDLRLWAAMLAAADARRPDTAVIDRALGSASPLLRAAAALSVGQNGVRARVPHLRALLADADTATAANAAFSLGLLRDTGSIASLADALQAEPSVARAAAWSLGELGAAARPTIETVLTRRAPAQAIPDVLIAAAKLRPLPVALLVPFVESDDPRVLWAAVYALTRSPAPAATRALVARGTTLSRSGATRVDVNPSRHLRAAPHQVRAFLGRGLAYPIAGDSMAGPALDLLRTLARDDHPHVRVNATRALATYGTRARAELVAATHDRDANVRIAAAQALNGVLADSRDDWLAAWTADTSFTYRRFVLVSAARSGVPLGPLDRAASDGWRTSNDWRARAAVAEAAAALNTTDPESQLVLAALNDPDGRVRNVALSALAPRLDSSDTRRHGWGRTTFVDALRDSDLFVRATALGALRAGARAGEVAVVLQSYDHARADRDNDARLAAVGYLAAAWNRDSASFDTALRSKISSLPVPADPLERAAAGAASPFASWRAARADPRPVEWYAEQLRAFARPALAGRPTVARLETERGTIEIELLSTDAPLTVANFAALARSAFYRGTRFHRVVPNFVAQDGDPRGDGGGGPGYAIRDELSRRFYERGAVGMALSGPDTGGSQYFLTHSPQPHLDGHYTVFGRVRVGLDVMDAVIQGDRILDVRIR